jgi:hypothetical protein
MISATRKWLLANTASPLMQLRPWASLQSIGHGLVYRCRFCKCGLLVIPFPHPCTPELTNMYAYGASSLKSTFPSRNRHTLVLTLSTLQSYHRISLVLNATLESLAMALLTCSKPCFHMPVATQIPLIQVVTKYFALIRPGAW